MAPFSPTFKNIDQWNMIISHESFQESCLKVVKPRTKWDIYKFPPFSSIFIGAIKRDLLMGLYSRLGLAIPLLPHYDYFYSILTRF